MWGGLLFSSSFVTWSWLPSQFGLIFYPLLPWLGVMLLGWAFGRWLLDQSGPDRDARIANRLIVGGVLALTVFFVQRWFDGYGNYWLQRTDELLLRWLHVSKYPPSLAFCALELGVMALCLAAFFRLPATQGSTRGPLLVFGQTALFLSLIHI